MIREVQTNAANCSTLKLTLKKYLHFGVCWTSRLGVCWTLYRGLSNISHLERMFVFKYVTLIIWINIVTIVKIKTFLTLGHYFRKFRDKLLQKCDEGIGFWLQLYKNTRAFQVHLRRLHFLVFHTRISVNNCRGQTTIQTVLTGITIHTPLSSLDEELCS